MGVGVGQIGLAGAAPNAQMRQLAQTTRQAVADLTQRVGVGQLTREHRGELCPAREALGITFAVVLAHQLGELRAQHLLKELTEETGGPYHGIALRGCVVNQDLLNLVFPRQRRASSI